MLDGELRVIHVGEPDPYPDAIKAEVKDDGDGESNVTLLRGKYKPPKNSLFGHNK